MAAFDIIDAAGKSYQFVWRERRYLLQQALLPLFIKAVCYALMVNLGWEQDYIRHALIMLPSYFADGWLMAIAIRLVFLEERVPPLFGQMKEDPVTSGRATMSGLTRGMLVFATVRFFLAGIVAFIYHAAETHRESLEADTAHAGWYVLSLALILFMIWAFRLFWIYIPAALGHSVRIFLSDIRGFMSSIYMIGAWLICMVPVLMLFAVAASAVMAIFGGPEAAGGTAAVAGIVLGLFHVVLDTLITLLTTAGIAYGLMAALSGVKPSA